MIVKALRVDDTIEFEVRVFEVGRNAGFEFGVPEKWKDRVFQAFLQVWNFKNEEWTFLPFLEKSRAKVKRVKKGFFVVNFGSLKLHSNSSTTPGEALKTVIAEALQLGKTSGPVNKYVYRFHIVSLEGDVQLNTQEFTIDTHVTHSKKNDYLLNWNYYVNNSFKIKAVNDNNNASRRKNAKRARTELDQFGTDFVESVTKESRICVDNTDYLKMETKTEQPVLVKEQTFPVVVERQVETLPPANAQSSFPLSEESPFGEKEMSCGSIFDSNVPLAPNDLFLDLDHFDSIIESFLSDFSPN